MTVTLEAAGISVVVDPDFGAEIRSIVAKRPGVELLMHTPWRATALRQRRAGLTFPASASDIEWMARYGGGWQILFPHAGPPEEVQGRERSYHGEASVVRWGVEAQEATGLAVAASLFSVPVTITRRFSVDGASLTVTDDLCNDSDEELLFDYAHHPAFGGQFLDEGCLIETGARRYVPDPRGFLGEFEPGVPLDWPTGVTRDGKAVALDAMVRRDSRIARFGWLEDFRAPWIALRNPRLDLGIRLSWTAPDLRYAWFWLEAGANRGAPWFGRGYTLAIEPSSTPPAGEGRRRLVLAPRQKRMFGIRLDLLPGRTPIRAAGADSDTFEHEGDVR